MVAKAEKSGGGEADAAASNQQQSRWRRSFSKPSWLLCNIADLDERMKTVTRKKIPKENSPDSFAVRANSYYHERPQLLELLNDLYNNYLSLADRYCQALARNQDHHHHHHHSRCSSPKYDENIHADEGDTGGELVDSSDAESLLSFQSPPVKTIETDVDTVVADVVMKTVEYDIVLNELNAVEKKWGESSRKIELQRNLLDVLETERLVLMNDNATLGHRVAALTEENEGLASESMFLKRKAGELARCVLKTREDRRVWVLSRKIEDLQGQIYGLEKRNKEYYERLVKRRERNVCCKGGRREGTGGERVDLEDCFRAGGGGGRVGLGKCFSFKTTTRVGGGKSGGVEGRKVSRLWDKVRRFDLLVCGPHFDSAIA